MYYLQGYNQANIPICQVQNVVLRSLHAPITDPGTNAKCRSQQEKLMMNKVEYK